MALYESVFIARQDLSGQQIEAMADEFEAIITEQGGTVAKKEFWGLRSLAYRIRKNRKGHYVLLNLDAPASAVQEFERRMRINEDILRYLTVKVEELEEGPSAVLQNKGRERDDRPGGGFGGRGDRGDRGGDRRGGGGFRDDRRGGGGGGFRDDRGPGGGGGGFRDDRGPGGGGGFRGDDRGGDRGPRGPRMDDDSQRMGAE